MDLLQGVHDAVDETKDVPLGNAEEPNLEYIINQLGGVDGLNDESRAKIVELLKAKGAKGMDGLLTQKTMEGLSEKNFSVEMMMLFAFLSVVFLVLVFFGYKLYTALTERERKKAEKRRQKLQKKKK